MQIGQLPEPGTPEFGLLARYRLAILNGIIPSSTSFADYQAAAAGTAAPGTTAFSTQARLRRAAIARAPLPATQGPPVFELPLRYAGEAATAAKGAVLGGLTTGTTIVILLAAGFLWFRVLRR